MRPNTLQTSKSEGGNEEEVSTSTVCSTPSGPTQLVRPDPNSRSEDNQMITRDDGTPYVVNPTIHFIYTANINLSCRREAPTQDLTSTFFAAATGTTVSGHARFTCNNTTSNQVTLLINRTSR